MSTNRLKVLLVSLLAVFAVSAVASSSASATCYKVAEKETGHFETWAKCAAGTPVIAKGEWINVEKLETRYKASGVGTPGEWCAKVETPKTGRFETLAKCVAGTPVITEGEYIRVLVPEYKVCQEKGTEEYTEHECKTKAAGAKWSFEPIEIGTSFGVEGTSGVSILELQEPGPPVKPIVKVECLEDKTVVGGVNNIKPGGQSEAEVEFTNCKVYTWNATTSMWELATACKVKEPILVETLDKLVETAAGTLEDEFVPKVAGNPFVTIKIENVAPKTCGVKGEYPITGTQLGKLPGVSTGAVSHTIEFKPSGSKLKGGATKEGLFTSTETVKLANGWAWRAP